MTTLAAIPVCDDQLDLLELVTDEQTPLGSLRAADFRDACWRDANNHSGWVNPNRVTAALHARFGEIKPQWYSAMWSGSCGPNGYMDKTDIEVVIDSRFSRGNGNKKVKLRKWRAAA